MITPHERAQQIVSEYLRQLEEVKLGEDAFHFKQWGAWAPEQPPIVRDWFVIDRDGNSFRQTTAWNGKTGSHSTTGEVYMYPAPKAAGRLLDGVEHLEVPSAN